MDRISELKKVFLEEVTSYQKHLEETVSFRAYTRHYFGLWYKDARKKNQKMPAEMFQEWLEKVPEKYQRTDEESAKAFRLNSGFEKHISEEKTEDPNVHEDILPDTDIENDDLEPINSKNRHNKRKK